jgi:hypothetical protein
MRNKQKTIESLRRLAERPGSPNEGEIARALLEQLGAKFWKARPFAPSLFPPGTVVYYCYWCYRNDRGVVRTKPPKVIQNQWWMLIKFDRLKQARWVPVTSELGCHLSLTPFEGNEQETLYQRDVDWEAKMEERIREFTKIFGEEAIGRVRRAVYDDTYLAEENNLNEPNRVALGF